MATAEKNNDRTTCVATTLAKPVFVPSGICNDLDEKEAVTLDPGLATSLALGGEPFF